MDAMTKMLVDFGVLKPTKTNVTAALTEECAGGSASAAGDGPTTVSSPTPLESLPPWVASFNEAPAINLRDAMLPYTVQELAEVVDLALSLAPPTLIPF